MRLVLLFLCVSAVHALPLNLTDVDSVLVIDGQSANQGKFPFVAFIKPSCAGVLISDRHVLAHQQCEEGAAKDPTIYFGLVAGNQDLSIPYIGVQKRNISKTDVLTFYDDPVLKRPYSLVLFTLDKPVEIDHVVAPISILRNDSEYNQNNDRKPTTLGYGVGHIRQGFPPYSLCYAVVSYLDPMVCRKQWENYRLLAACAGEHRGGDRLFWGDNGAPLVYEDKVLGLAEYNMAHNSAFYVRVTPFCGQIEKIIGRTVCVE